MATLSKALRDAIDELASAVQDLDAGQSKPREGASKDDASTETKLARQASMVRDDDTTGKQAVLA